VAPVTKIAPSTAIRAAGEARSGSVAPPPVIPITTSPAAVIVTPTHCRRPRWKPKKRSANTARKTSPPERTACTIDSGASGERTDMQAPGQDHHAPADQEPSGAKETDGAAHQVTHLDWGGEHRAAVFEQKAEVGGHRRSERKDQSKDHEQQLASQGWEAGGPAAGLVPRAPAPLR
jgi:hypothetical protein